MKKPLLILSSLVVLTAIALLFLSSASISPNRIRLSDVQASRQEQAMTIAPPIIAAVAQMGSDDWRDQAKALYAQNCSSCHGAAGQGSTIAPPLNNPTLRQLESEALYATIAGGRPGTPMPAWGGRLSPEEINALVALIRNWETLNETELQQMADQAPDTYQSGWPGMMGGGMFSGRGQQGMMAGDPPESPEMLRQPEMSGGMGGMMGRSHGR